MSHSHSDRRGRGGPGTALLAGACCLGAVTYAVFVGPSMLPPQDVEAANASSPEVLGSVIEPSAEEPETRAPVGSLRVQVIDRHHAWVQTLECEGDPEGDPQACAALAEAAEGTAGDPTASVPPEDEEEIDPEDDPGADTLFAEVRDGTVCTDKVYGPQQAVIEGTWEGREIDTALSRRGSCEEARWQRLTSVTDRFENG
ncbi:hypothetical protein ABZ645_03225 [Nocardiopsis alba]|uniref:hypothetical protein n=1 Tax=Nocardiopsis alba TaxID=53437 RepID=UPI0033C59767